MPIFATANGRIIPNTDTSSHNYTYYPATQEKGSFLRCAISVLRPGNQKDEKGYPKSDLWTVKAFGGTADLINRCWGPGKNIIVIGDMTMSDEYVSPTDGTVYPPRPEIIANRVCFGDTAAKDNEEAAPFSNPAPMTKQTNAKPPAVHASTQRRNVPWQSGQK